jgi:hypothetical protein
VEAAVSKVARVSQPALRLELAPESFFDFFFLGFDLSSSSPDDEFDELELDSADFADSTRKIHISHTPNTV